MPLAPFVPTCKTFRSTTLEALDLAVNTYLTSLVLALPGGNLQSINLGAHEPGNTEYSCQIIASPGIVG